MQGFEYPTEAHVRRHGPSGYQDYESYRDWLRDEFMFRCVYCLNREQWCSWEGAFHIEHFIPVAQAPYGELDYANLVYACARCNSAKGGILGVPDPCRVAFADCVRIGEDGQLEAINDAGKSLIMKLRLNNIKNVQHRRRWMRALAALQIQDPDLYREFMAFPDELPDLRTKRVPLNSRRESVGDCFCALRERGELPATY